MYHIWYTDIYQLPNYKYLIIKETAALYSSTATVETRGSDFFPFKNVKSTSYLYNKGYSLYNTI